MADTIVAKRGLGTGRWDMALKKRMVELSNADNYDDAKEEWIATGSVWWGSDDEHTPDWVTQRGKCLCGHSVVYHFEILNTETNHRDCVGSDHINTYLIMKEISRRTGIDVADITQGDIDKWIQERTKTMMAKSWMSRHGEHFNRVYDAIKEVDILINVKGTPSQYWSREDNKYLYRSSLRKKGEGQPTDMYYQMASIVWRWEHPQNNKSQSQTRGYPTDKLWQDMLIFQAFVPIKHKERYDALISRSEKATTDHHARLERQKVDAIHREEKRRLAAIAWEEGREEREANALDLARIRAEEAAKHEKRRYDASQKLLKASGHTDGFTQMCQYYGIRPFNEQLASNAWESRFLGNIKGQLDQKKELTKAQLQSLKEILAKQITLPQINYLKSLGYTPEDNILWGENLTRKQASEEIERLKEK
mgnify:FL=1